MRGQLLFHAPLAIGGRLQLHLPRATSSRDSSAFTSSSRSRVGRSRSASSFCAARRVALDSRQILVDLRQLILQRRRLAQQPQHVLPPGFERPARAAAASAALLALGGLCRQPIARATRVCASSSATRVQMRLQLLAQLRLPLLQFLRLRSRPAPAAARCADLLSLRFQPPARPLLVPVATRRASGAPRSARLRCDSRLPAAPCAPARFSATWSDSSGIRAVRRFKSSAVFAASRSSMRNAAGERLAQMRDHLALQLFVAPRFRRLPLQRIHLPRRLLPECRTRAPDSASRLPAWLPPAACAS